jgi:hypothetical protein
LPLLEDPLAAEIFRELTGPILSQSRDTWSLCRLLTRSVPPATAERLVRLIGFPDAEHAALHCLANDPALMMAQVDEVSIRPDVLTVTSPWLTQDVRNRRFAAALENLDLSDERVRMAFARIVPSLPAELVEQARELVDDLDEDDRLTMYVALAQATSPPAERAHIERYLHEHADRIIYWPLNSRGVLADLARGGFGKLALDLCARMPNAGEFWDPLDLLGAQLDEALIPVALELSEREADEARAYGLRSVLARWASFGAAPARAALATSYRTGLPREESQAVALALSSGEPVGGWTPALGALASDDLRYAVLASVCSRSTLRAEDAGALLELLDPSMIGWGVRSVVTALGREIVSDAAAALVARALFNVAGRQDEHLQAEQIYLPYLRAVAEVAGGAQALMAAHRLPGRLDRLGWAVLATEDVGGLGEPALESLVQTAVAQARDSAKRPSPRSEVFAWDVANLLTKLLRVVSADQADTLWQVVEETLDGQQAELSVVEASQLFRYLPERFRIRARALVLPAGYAEGRSVYERTDNSRPDGAPSLIDLPTAWADGAAELIDSFSLQELEQVSAVADEHALDTIVRYKLHAAIAVRYARAGEVDHALERVQGSWELVDAQALMELGTYARPGHLEDWVTVVLNKLSSDSHLRAAVLASAGGRWAQTSASTRWAVIDRWLGRHSWRYRTEIAADAVGLAPLLLMLCGVGDRIVVALRTDPSLTVLGGLVNE